eukprot:359394-Chlamydomonas_euryale.AAC.5
MPSYTSSWRPDTEGLDGAATAPSSARQGRPARLTGAAAAICRVAPKAVPHVPYAGPCAGLSVVCGGQPPTPGCRCAPGPAPAYLVRASAAGTLCASKRCRQPAAMSGKDLLENLDLSGVHCLNEQPGHAWANALKQGYRDDDGEKPQTDLDSAPVRRRDMRACQNLRLLSLLQMYAGLVLESDADEQLLLNIPLSQKSKLSSIAIKGPDDGTGPKSVKLFVNLPSCGFSDAESVPPAQQFELTADQLAGEPIP